jgi:hypothetical protein
VDVAPLVVVVDVQEPVVRVERVEGDRVEAFLDLRPHARADVQEGLLAHLVVLDEENPAGALDDVESFGLARRCAHVDRLLETLRDGSQREERLGRAVRHLRNLRGLRPLQPLARSRDRALVDRAGRLHADGLGRRGPVAAAGCQPSRQQKDGEPGLHEAQEGQNASPGKGTRPTREPFARMTMMRLGPA